MHNQIVRTAARVLVASGAVVSSASVYATEPPELPLRSITLYLSGVGSFEHEGTVTGDANVSLAFDRDRVNDVLKSLVVLDLDGGRVASASYAANETLARRLAALGVDIADRPTIGVLLGRLRGEGIRLTTSEGPVVGTILGAEHRGMETVINVLTDSTVRSVSMSKVLNFELLDESLARDLHAALAMIASHRVENSATIDLEFTGEGDRRAVVAYVHETPIWKTTYRLVLPEETSDTFTLQGWAIVENTTGNDWENVRLSLAAGNPVSFVMNLHDPMFVVRPTLPIPAMGSLVSRVYDSTVEAATHDRMRAAMHGSAGLGEPSQSLAERRTDYVGQDTSPARGARPPMITAEAMEKHAAQPVATGSEVGHQFHYTIDAPVTIERQRSAMLPIMQTPVTGRRVSIYNHSDLERHPMRGVEFTNTGAVPLAAGPITVYDGGAYAGDAQIGFTSRGQDRILTYAADNDVRVLRVVSEQEDVARLTISDGMIRREDVHRVITSYRFINRDGSRERTVIVEQPKRDGWDVVAPERIVSESETLRRFEITIDAGDETSLGVVEERTSWTMLAVSSIDLPTVLQHAQRGKVSDRVLAVFRKASELQANINALNTELQTATANRDTLFRDQSRIRENMGRVDRTSDLYARYMRTLSEQEDALEALGKEITRLNQARWSAQVELQEFMRNNADAE